MKVSICTGSKCGFYGASHIIDCMLDMKECLHDLPGVRPDAELEIELVPCQGFCQGGNHGVAPVVYVDGQMIERAEGPQIMEIVMNYAQGERNE